jgi:hypothetical protein
MKLDTVEAVEVIRLTSEPNAEDGLEAIERYGVLQSAV